MGGRVNYTVVGIFVVAFVTAFIVIVLWLSVGTRKTYDTYLVYMNEAVSGLTEQAPVRFNGVTVGFVKTIRLNPKNPKQVLLTLEIEEDTPITTSTVAVLMAQGITGVTYIGLKANTVDAPLLTQKPGEKYPVIPSEPSLLVELDTALREVSGDVNEVSSRIKNLLSEENLKSLQQILQNLQIVSQSLSASSANIQNSIANVKQSSQQVLPQLSEFMNELTQSSQYLKQLLRELKDNPSLLIRGAASASKGPGE